MALYKVALRLAHDVSWAERKRWSTTFFIEAGSPSLAASLVAEGWIDHLRNAAVTTVFAYEAYATDLNPASESYDVVSIAQGSQRGTLASPAGDRYMLKACIAVTLGVSGSRPSRKFWRPGLSEFHVENGRSVVEALNVAIYNAFNGMIAGGGGAFVDPDGQALTVVTRTKLTTREFGRTAGSDLPESPPVG